MASLDLLDSEIGGIPSNAGAVFGSIAMNGDEYVHCNRCGYGGCDVRVAGCGCTMHAVRFRLSMMIFLVSGFLFFHFGAVLMKGHREAQ